ncbi:unnamed protein product, partial [Brenthis ino]
MVEGTHSINKNTTTTRPVLHYVRGPRQCSLRHRIPLPTGCTRRERTTTSRCSVHHPAPRAPRALQSPPRGPYRSRAPRSSYGPRPVNHEHTIEYRAPADIYTTSFL